MENLREIIKNAYAPYSDFRVAACVTLQNGQKFYGVNVENASFGGTICAERNAINSAVKAGYRKGDFASLTVLVEKPQVSFPCFLCRQSIVEFFDPFCDLILMADGETRHYKMSDIIVNPFTKKDLS